MRASPTLAFAPPAPYRQQCDQACDAAATVLTEVEFSCLVDRNALQAEIKNIVSSKYPPGGGAFTLRRIYCEVGQHHNFVLLLALLHHSPNANDLHVHLVCGDFQKTVEACRGLLATHRQLETFTFTSELPSPIQDEPVPPFDFATLAAVCQISAT
ncbi:hypothetical protein HPB52_024745 [Rhipicephalus sanguineus]|uniref:Uncharacterized protein n=1 Tax=Rhipicephalus sanguineus TaxID=34632 RepID=A0A9D4TDY6_RHISA|nr:hypothetical protein HPB52_024745 [Rhipicephalus sanguineus]